MKTPEHPNYPEIPERSPEQIAEEIVTGWGLLYFAGKPTPEKWGELVKQFAQAIREDRERRLVWPSDLEFRKELFNVTVIDPYQLADWVFRYLKSAVKWDYKLFGPDDEEILAFSKHYEKDGPDVVKGFLSGARWFKHQASWEEKRQPMPKHPSHEDEC